MINNEILEILGDIPKTIEGLVDIEKPNEPIVIYVGEYKLQTSEKEIIVNGKIQYDWIPDTGAYFYGTSSITLDKYHLLTSDSYYKVIVDDLEFGEGFFTGINFNSSSNLVEIKGVISGEAIFGDKSVSVERVLFSIPNLRSIHGDPTHCRKGERISTLMSRLTLENEDYVIKIDKSKDFRDRDNSLDEKGGYHILYHGELTPKKSSLQYDEILEVVNYLNEFLTFLNGRRTGAMFLQGIFEEKAMWVSYTDYFVDPHKDVISWMLPHSIDGLNELWRNFSKLRRNENDASFLSGVIHWYVESNKNQGFSDGSIVMAQVGLELLYNWWIVENKKLIIGKDSENISASNKIRLLLSQANLDYSVPKAFTKLQNFVKTEKDVSDAPEAVVQIRNAIVHSQQEKRRKLGKIDSLVRHEALQLCISYIELSLLCILKYKDSYSNRCSGHMYPGEREALVPWLQKS